MSTPIKGNNLTVWTLQRVDNLNRHFGRKQKSKAAKFRMDPLVQMPFTQATRDVIGPAKVLPENDHSGQPPCVSALDDNSVLKRPLPHEIQHWRRLTIIVCALSIYLTLLLSMVGFVSSVHSGSSATLAIACDALLAIISSGTVIWRFCSKEEKNCERLKKERRACFIIALCFIVSAILVSIHSLVTLIEDDVPQQPESTLVFAIINSVFYFLLFLAKYSLAEKLQSASLRADSVDAITGAATAFSVVICTIIVEEVQDAWFVDACVALAIAILTFFYGLQLLVRVIRARTAGEGSSGKLEEWSKLL